MRTRLAAPTWGVRLAAERDMVTGGDLLVQALEATGVPVVFGLPGVHNLPAWKAFAGSGIRLVGVRHEQAAAYGADGFARATGGVGVALTTTGPGAANTLGAVGEAWASRSPVLVIATDIATTLRRPGVYRGALHETTDQAGMFAPVTKATVRVTEPKEIPAAVRLAAWTATDAPSRPVYLEIPTDSLGATVTGGHVEADITDSRAVLPPDDVLEDAVRRLERAQHPLVWAGGGALQAGASVPVGSLAERLAAPVLTTYSARGLLGADHPCSVGLPPHVPEVGALWDEADVVLAIGTDLDGMMTQNWAMPQPPTLLTVNIDADDAAKNYRPHLHLGGDAAVVTEALARRVGARDGVEELYGRLEAIRSAVRDDLGAEQPGALEFLAAVEAALPPETMVVADMCIPGYWLAGFHRVPAPRRFAYPMGWGTLGFAFPTAIGAALASTGPVVSVSGDGGFLFACGELATVAQERIPLTAVVVDDGGYGMLRYDQLHAGDPTFGVDLVTPDFEAMAASFGLEAETVEGLGQKFGTALRRHVLRGAPSVLVVRAALDPPPTTSPRWYRRR